MKTRILGVAILGACLGATVALHASDLVGIYAVVEKVVLEPSDSAPNGRKSGARSPCTTKAMAAPIKARNAGTSITRALRGRNRCAGRSGRI